MSETLRKRGPLIGTVVIVAAVVIGFVFFTQVYADVLWFDQLGYLDVFFKEYGTRIGLFVVGFLITAGVTYLSLNLAYRSRPTYAADAIQADTLARYQAQVAPIRRLLMYGIPVLLGVFAGAALFGQWQTVLLFFFQESFGQTDPEFGMDVSFYVNTLPFLTMVIGFLMTVVVIAGIAGILTQYLYGGIRLEERSVVFTTASRVQVIVFASLFLLLQAVNFWLDRYLTLGTVRENWTGAMYTDVNAVIPTKTILAIASILVVILLVVTAVSGRWRFSVIGSAMLVVTMIVAGGIYPAVIQQFQVRPTEEGLESPFIERNITMTRQAYGLDQIESTEYSATTDAEPGALRQDAATTANIRLMDPNVIGAAFSQLQQFRQFYGFPANLSVDRYNIDGNVTDTVIAVRELRTQGVPGDWVNQVINYTHGYGVVAASGSRAAADGKPDFLQSGMPSSGILGDDSDYEPRIYFGESSPTYSIVGAPEGSAPQEIDRPQDAVTTAEGQDAAAASDATAARYTFDGNGGPDVGNLFNRLVYSIKFQSTDLLLSNNVNEESQILYDRSPRERVQKVAPYLTVDSSTYPAVVDGRVKWIVDAYTTSANYPYSTPTQLAQATRDALNRDPRSPQLNQNVNYVRNAVKATVDAYDGSVELYAWDDQDPILKAWQNVFPTSLKPYSEMSGELMSHVRYPEDQFKVQRELLGRYHVTDSGTFFRNDDAWMVPDDPTNASPGSTTSTANPAVSNTGIKQPPYYLSLQMPGQDSTAFSLTSTFIPFSPQGETPRNVLYGFLAASGDAGAEAGVKSDEYGTLRLLELPRDVTVPGPGQAQNRFNSDPDVSRELNLLRQGASTVENGNLLTLPVGGGMLYVQPVFVRSSGDSSYPTLQRVLVNFGERVGFAATLDEALDQVFGGDSGVTAEDAGNNQGGGGATEDPGDGGTATTTPSENLRSALDRANQAIQDGEAALAEGDFAAYGVAQQQLQEAIADALEAEQQAAGSTPAPTDGASDPTESPAPSPTPSG